jgi:hypothetical protein
MVITSAKVRSSWVTIGFADCRRDGASYLFFNHGRIRDSPEFLKSGAPTLPLRNYRRDGEHKSGDGWSESIVGEGTRGFSTDKASTQPSDSDKP